MNNVNDLHSAIMNLPCAPKGITVRLFVGDEMLAYKLGHRDARHAAAELATIQRPAAQEELSDLLAGLVAIWDKKARGRAGSPNHGHTVPGIWDWDNGELAGKPCAECALYDKARALAATRTPEPLPAGSAVLNTPEPDRYVDCGEERPIPMFHLSTLLQYGERCAAPTTQPAADAARGSQRRPVRACLGRYAMSEPITLPPLPSWAFNPFDFDAEDRENIQAYALSAIEADRKARADDELTPWELMRAIDAYAYDYKEQGKLSESRKYVEQQLAFLIEAQRAAVLEECAEIASGWSVEYGADEIESAIRSLIDKEAP